MHKVFEMILDLNFIKRNMEVTYLACINLQQLMVGNIKLVVKLTSQNASKYFDTVLFFLQKPPYVPEQKVTLHATTKAVARSKMVDPA